MVLEQQTRENRVVEALPQSHQQNAPQLVTGHSRPGRLVSDISDFSATIGLDDDQDDPQHHSPACPVPAYPKTPVYSAVANLCCATTETPLE